MHKSHTHNLRDFVRRWEFVKVGTRPRWRLVWLLVLVAACDLGHHAVDDAGVDEGSGTTACSASCHGSGGESAPPRDTTGRSDPGAIGNGAHRAHLASSKWRKRVECVACHKVPTDIGEPGHIDTELPAELIFTGMGDGATWNRDTETCTNSYCHGATLTNSIGSATGTTGGTVTEPKWTLLDGSQKQCDSCHGNPPPAPHPQEADCGLCHPTMNPGEPTTIAYFDLHIDGHVDVVNTAACDSCHGSTGQSAPPKDVAGNTATTARGVGAHTAHLTTGSNWHATINCIECHKVPAGVNDQGHIDPAPAELVFGPLAGNGVWNGATCTNTYCHGSSAGPLVGGTATAPIWTQVDGTQSQCGSCHGAPPPAPHPIDANCASCHPTMTAGAGLTIAYPALHIDGKVDIIQDQACNTCHGSAASNAPPLDTTGGTTTDLRTVGAHRNHLDPSTWRKNIDCVECHKTPTAVFEIGHIDSPRPAELKFGVLAGGAVWNGSTCTNTYCHGATLQGGTSINPVWTNVNGLQAQCGSCHGAPPPPPHPVDADCGLCHNTMTQGMGLVITDPARHIDGNVDVTGDQPCNTCHGGVTGNAPPADTTGHTATNTRGVGAHQAHLATTNRFNPVACEDCHRVPTGVVSLGHIDTPLPAELTFSVRAGTTTAFNGSRCSNNYCHGATLTNGTGGAGGTATAPIWTTVDGSQAQCSSCHGNPPPSPHPALTDCGLCHGNVMLGSPTVFTAPLKHIDGNVDVSSSAQACNACHGSATSDAPPKDTAGNSATTVRGVGAHQAHLKTSSTQFTLITCDNCHLVPATVDAPGHIDTASPAELTFSGVGTGSTFNGTTCTSYCHGSTLAAGGTATTPLWTKVDGTQKQCTSCHGAPPPPPHPTTTDCGLCHNTMTAGGGLVISAPTRHIDGIVDVNLNQACNSCHGSATSDAPPKDTLGSSATTVRGVGAHQAHLAASTTHRDVPCGECHQVPSSVDAVGHIDSALPAELSFTDVATGSTFNGTTCTSYCHGSTLAAGGTATTPKWTQVDGTQRQCTSCHGNPPPLPHPQDADCGSCHNTIAAGSPTTFLDRTRHVDGVVDVTTNQPCNFCHGGAANDAPPLDTLGNTATTGRGVGAHQSHLVPTNKFRPVSCNDCHLVPATLTATGHIDTALPAELKFSTKAGAATFNGVSCTNSYCHGVTLGGGVAKTPAWTTVNGSLAQCNSCHGNPPPAPHPQMTNCGLCHNNVVPGSPTTFSDASRHVDTNLDVTTNLACNACHGSATNDAPPKDTAGNSAISSRGVGAHQVHLATNNVFKAVLCTDCHRVPATMNATGHVDTALPAELTFSTRAGTATAFNGTTCTNNYCHGATLAAGGLVTKPVWTTVNGTQVQCNSCHGNPPPPPHPAATNCGQCHNDVVLGSPTTFSAPSRHTDGILDVTTNLACNACHGSTTNDAPPKDTAGNSLTTVRGVGAHQTHLVTTSITHKLVTCNQCHTVPTTLSSIGHIDTPLPAELKFTGLAAGSTFNGSTCTSYCHGSTLAAGGAATTPLWTKVDGTQKQCTSCHGNPPPLPHPANSACQSCHPNAGANSTFTNPAQHIDGTLQVTMVHPAGYSAREIHGYDFDKLGSSTCATAACHGTTLAGGGTAGGPSCNGCHNNWQTSCTFCHGTSGNGAPPQGVLAQTAPTDKHVGAHTEHVTATANHAAMACATCHTNPSSALTPGHIDGTGSVVQAEVRYGSLNPAATYNTTTAVCTNLYCHGNGRTAAGTSTWTSTTALTCAGCHPSNGQNMSGRHDTHVNGQAMKCNACHQTVVNSTLGIIAPALHVNGLKEVKMPTGTWTPSNKSCSGLPGGCHGTKTW